MREAELARNVEELCRYLGVRYYHTWNSRNSVAGFPDLVLLTKDGRVLWRELKGAGGRVSDKQLEWQRDLLRCRQDVDFWWPDDWPDRIRAELSPRLRGVE